MQDLTGKTAIIIGASRGIGEAAAHAMASYGMNVMLAARSCGDIERIAAEIGPQADAMTCDVASYDDVRQLVARARDHFGTVDVLVNNAGLIEPIALIGDSDAAEWSTVIDVNLKGIYYGIRAVLPVMQKQGRGVIINISSGAASGVLEGWSDYCAGKTAVLSLTRATDLEYRAAGIRSAGLSPGTVRTHMQVAISKSKNH